MVGGCSKAKVIRIRDLNTEGVLTIEGWWELHDEELRHVISQADIVTESQMKEDEMG
jgi:hypothetical protein